MKVINIELNDKYNITSDKLNFILQEKRIKERATERFEKEYKEL